jgi:phage gpG-like protein
LSQKTNVNVQTSFKVPVSWTAKDSLTMGLDIITLIKMRTMKGISSEGKPFNAYSTNKIYIPFKGARLKPKGGVVSRTGLSMMYPKKKGYREYKHLSRRRARGGGGQTAEVDLTLSGALMSSLTVLKSTINQVVVGIGPASRHYGYYVHQVRPFIGLTKSEESIIIDAIAENMRSNLK